MNKGVKVALIVLGVSMLGGAIIVAAGVVWVVRNADDLKAEADAATAEGRAFGRTREDLECVDAALARVDECLPAALMCEVRAGIFLRGCVEGARATPQLCAGVPPKDSILESSMWAIKTCGDKGRNNDQPCARMMQELHKICGDRLTPVEPGRE